MDQEIQELITKVLSGEALPEERRKLIEWVDANEENALLFRQTESLWNAVEIIANTDGYDANQAYRKFSTAIRPKENRMARANEKRSRTWAIGTFVRYAAAIVILLGLLAGVYTAFYKASAPDISLHEISTPAGGKTQIKLPDGTLITLNAASTLRYPSQFGTGQREVYLDGEGYFDVVKDANRPFIVKTSHIQVRVLGTVFNVKSYREEKTIETTLISGAVVIEKNGRKQSEMKPNQRVIFLKKEGKLLLEKNALGLPVTDTSTATGSTKESFVFQQHVDTEPYISWKDDELLFDDEQFESIAVKLARRYAVNISFKDEEVKKYRFSGRFEDITLEQALIALQYASPFEYVISSEGVYISSSKKRQPAKFK